MKRARSDDESAPRAQAPDKPDYTCSARNCPARATIFDTVTHAPRGGRCRYHDAAPPAKWAEVTRILNLTQSVEETNERLAAIDIAVRVLPEPPPTSRELGRIVTSLDEKLPSGETPRQIIARLQALLHRERDPDQWWQDLTRRWRAGEELLAVQYSAAMQAWAAAGRPLEHGPPDAEAIAERLAIQSEPV